MEKEGVSGKVRILTVVGARPQFIKAAAVSRVIRRHHTEILLHTGQHYDADMSDIFFKELGIPKPDYQLGIGSGSHAQQTAGMMTGIERVLLAEKPDCLLIYGDTNSTLAGALAASKIQIPVAHVEAGLRSCNKCMPEEINRILSDHVSDLLFCPTDAAVENLRKEGIETGVSQVGDVMCDALLYYSERMQEHDQKFYFSQLHGLGQEKAADIKQWYLATIHRAENTDSMDKIREILAAFEELDAPVLFPVHPRIRTMVKQLDREYGYRNILFTEPAGYLTMLYLLKHARKAVTDSGGLQKEAYMLDTPCVTVRDQTEWRETLEGGHNVLAKPEKEDILSKVYDTQISQCRKPQYYGDGHAADKICGILDQYGQGGRQ